MKFEVRRTIAAGRTAAPAEVRPVRALETAAVIAYREAEAATDAALSMLDRGPHGGRFVRRRARTTMLPMGSTVDRRQLR
jgi:hypothetical protein